MDFKATFLDLTKYTIPYGDEHIVSLLLPRMDLDDCGNYYTTIGNNPTTLFTCHLDTACNERKRINHVINGNIIKTDGTTILGADDKAGVCILMYMIEKGVSGMYYFFVGEEIGCYGSRFAMANNPEHFKNIKRAVAFDRGGKGSIITKQRNGVCASNEFAEALSKEYAKQGMSFYADTKGSFTDTAIFTKTISECTNISVGYYNEHTVNEFLDIRYCEQVAKASALIEWENLPTIRDVNMRFIRRFR